MHPSGLKHTWMQTRTHKFVNALQTHVHSVAHWCILDQNNMKTKHERVSRTAVEHVLGLKVARVSAKQTRLILTPKHYTHFISEA